MQRNLSHDQHGTSSTLTPGDDITLCVMRLMAKWSKSRSSAQLTFRKNNQVVESRPVFAPHTICSVGAVRLSKPGDSFTVQVVHGPSSPLTIGIGVEHSSHVEYDGFGIGEGVGIVGAWLRQLERTSDICSADHKRCITEVQMLDQRMDTTESPHGDHVTVTLVQRDPIEGAEPENPKAVLLSVSFAMDETVHCEIALPNDVQPPFVPLCTCPPPTCLKMVQAVGEFLPHE